MPKNEPGSPMYAVADRFVDVALRRDDSLFTPERSIWSLPNLDELDRLYVQRPDLGGDSFEEKLRKQLDGGSPAAYQLMAEVMFVFYLPARWNISAATKRQKIEEVLSWSPDPVPLPSDLSEVLEHGVGSGGQGMLMYKWASLVFLLSFARRWKQASPDVRQVALADPWKFREFVAQIPTDGGGIYGRESLLHLVFPDTFERIFSGRDKWRLTEQMKQLVDEPDANVDLKISQVRAKLGARFGSSFDFYDTDGVRALWKPFDSKLDEFIFWASRFHELEEFDADERDYKLEITSRLTVARDALLAGADWLPLLKRAFSKPNNLTPWQAHDTFLKWCQSDLAAAEKLLRRLWRADDEADPLERLGDFFAHFSKDVLSGMGSRTTIGSFFMLAIDPYTYPPYRVAATHAAYHLTGHEQGEEKDELSMYRAGLAFLDKLRERATERGLELRDRLDAQSVLWAVTSWGVPAEWPAEDQAAFEKYRHGATEEDEEDLIGDPSPTGEVKEPAAAYDPLIALANELLIDHESLTEISDLLKTKGQIIFYGPPGTGKTYIARKLAALAGDDANRVRLVQFHPSYAYEDFVEGYRPQTLENGQPTFSLVHGPLRVIAQQATEDAGRDYYLIVDEINRGNIAKVFGELYFLLEYRDEGIHLQYSPERQFKLPANLKIIGTMNTADRSIALMDAALRRRFTFVPFFPDQKPIHGVLSRWLRRHRSDMAWVADVVDAANRELADRNGAIGPSFFMRKELNEKRLDLIWKHEIIPYLEDYYFDRPERVKAFALATLRKSLEAPVIDPLTLASASSADSVSASDGPTVEDEPVAPDAV